MPPQSEKGLGDEWPVVRGDLARVAAAGGGEAKTQSYFHPLVRGFLGPAAPLREGGASFWGRGRHGGGAVWAEAEVAGSAREGGGRGGGGRPDPEGGGKWPQLGPRQPARRPRLPCAPRPPRPQGPGPAQTSVSAWTASGALLRGAFRCSRLELRTGAQGTWNAREAPKERAAVAGTGGGGPPAGPREDAPPSRPAVRTNPAPGPGGSRPVLL